MSDDEVRADLAAAVVEIDCLRVENRTLRRALADTRFEGEGGPWRCPLCRRYVNEQLDNPDEHSPDCPYLRYPPEADDA